MNKVKFGFYGTVAALCVVAAGLGIRSCDQKIIESDTETAKSIRSLTATGKIFNTIYERDDKLAKRIDSLSFEMQKMAMENQLLKNQIDSLKKVAK